MRKLIMVLALGVILTANAQQTITVSVENPMNVARTDQPVVIPLAGYGLVSSALVTTDGQEVPSQLDDLDLDEQFDELCFLADLKASEKKTYTIELTANGAPRPYPSRVYAEMLRLKVLLLKSKRNEEIR